MTPMPGTPNDRRRAQEAFGGGGTERTRPSNFDGREPRPTVKAMFSTNEGDDALLDEAFDVVEAEARAALLGEVREGVNSALVVMCKHDIPLIERNGILHRLDTLADGGPK